MSRSKPEVIRHDPISNENEILRFGKYKGKSIKEVMEWDGQYLAWLHNNSVFFELSPELLEKAEGWKDEDYTQADIYGKP